ncbi:MAG: 50S ribosomal protein L11 methyltransferase [Campylobacteraceae bacterium]|jgi:ribosomal protein L11 methyltransferase|nr:50S ribosomal protein L11 methyltransferase [Campylobacteraceae bacterium]
MCEKYFELCVYPSSNSQLFSDFLLEFLDAVEEGDGCLIARSSLSLDTIEFGVQEYAKKLGIEVNTTLTQKQNEDWIKKYQESVRPVTVGNLHIRPSWEEPKDGFLDIVIDPALAFGSGHHESTYGCLLMLQRYVGVGSRFLDVGTGSGILAIAAAKLGAIVDICDTDSEALIAANENFAKNSVKYKNSWTGSANEAPIKYGVIAANIIADVLLVIENDLIGALIDDGILILSGILDKYTKRVKERYAALSLIDEFQENEWHTLVYKR